MSEFIKVHCQVPNGVILRLFEKVEGPFGTSSHFASSQVILRAGENDVYAGFWNEWMKVNSDNDLIKEKLLERKD